MASRPHSLSWRQAAVATVGVMAFLIAAACLKLGWDDITLLIFQDRYRDAEFEIVTYHLAGPEGPSGSSSLRHGKGQMSRTNAIDGIIRPGDLSITTNDRDVQLVLLVPSDSIAVRMPTRADVEGKRLKVLFWFGDEAGRSWYHPPRVTTRLRPTIAGVFTIGLVFAVSSLVALGCFRYAYDRQRGARHQIAERRPSPWPAWTALAIAGFVLVAPFTWLVILAAKAGVKINAAGTERVPYESSDWIVAGLMIGVMSVVPLMCLIALTIALRKRLTFRTTADVQ